MAQALAIGGGILKGFSQIGAGINAQKTANYNAAVNEAQGVQATQTAAETETRQRNQFRYFQGSQIAAEGSNGFEVGSGSALDVMTDSAISAERDALDIRYRGASQTQALNTEAGFQRRQGRLALGTGIIQGVQTFAETAAKAATPAPGGGG